MLTFKAGNAEVCFTFGFFVLLAVSALADTTGISIFALAAVAIHEGGHLCMMRRHGAAVSAMTFSAFGIRLYKKGMLSYPKETAVYFGGVAANAAAAFLCMLALAFTGANRYVFWNTSILTGGPQNITECLALFMGINLFLFCFNLIPIGRLDGGVLLRLALIRAGLWEIASTLQKGIGLVLLAPLFCAALWMLRYQNFVLLFTSAYLAAGLFCDGGES